jgi:dihydrofolate reductase
MGAIVATTLISLDGQVDEPMRFAAPFFDAEALADAAEILDASDGVLFGRATYEAFARAWAGRSGVYADRLRAVTKYVVSSTTTDIDWERSELLSADPISDIATLTQRHGKRLVVYGHGRLTQTLLTAGLIDRYRFNLHQVWAGDGFRPVATSPVDLELTNVRRRGSGVVVLDYATRPGGR